MKDSSFYDYFQLLKIMDFMYCNPVILFNTVTLLTFLFDNSV